MKIVDFKIKNYKSVTVDLSPNGKSVTILGRNGAGKSSTIEAIMNALSNIGAVSKPVQIGKTTASTRVTVKLEKDYTVGATTFKAGTLLVCERKYDEDGSKLTVSVRGGEDLKRPKELLDFIMNISTLRDPGDLMNKTPLEQKKFVMELVGLNFDEIDAEKSLLTKRKSDAHTEFKQLQKEVDAFPEIESDIERKDASEISVKIQQQNQLQIEKSTAYQTLVDERKSESDLEVKLEAEKRRIEELENALISAKANVESYKKKMETALTRIAVLEKEYEAMVIPDVDYNAELQAIEQNNKRYDQRQLMQQKVKDLGAKEDSIDLLQEQIMAVEQKRVELIQTVKMPIDDFSFTDEGLLWKGLPVKGNQISESQGYELWMDIVIASNPNLRVIYFKSGNSFDSNTLARIFEKAKYHDFQILLEKVTDDDKIQFIIHET